MKKIIIEPGNPLSLRKEYLQAFLDDLNSAVESQNIEVEFREKEQKYGVTFWEVIRIYLEDIPKEIQDVIVLKILELGVKWVKKRFKTIYYRPKSITIYDSTNIEIARNEFPAKKREEMIDEWEYFYQVLYTLDDEEKQFLTLYFEPLKLEALEQEVKNELSKNKIVYTSLKIKKIVQLTKEDYMTKVINGGSNI